MLVLAVVTRFGGSSNDPASEQVLIVVVAGVILALLTWGARRVSKKENARTKDMTDLRTTVHDISAALITPAKTQLNPDPKPGLIDVVAGHSKTLAALLKGTEALIVDKNRNDGTTSRDALNRIEEATTTIIDEQSRVKQEGEKS